MGDIHGCFNETIKLLNQIKPTLNDVVISVGDFVDRGPQIYRCIKFWRDQGYKAVLGNHDERIIKWAEGEKVPQGDCLSQTIRQIEQHPYLIEYLKTLPTIIHFPEIDVVAVHAAVNVNLNISDQINDPKNNNIHLRGRFVRELNGSFFYVPLDQDLESDFFWANIWSGPQTVVYGHTPILSGKIKISNYAIGIDTACVYGASLSAAVYEPYSGWSYYKEPALKCYLKPAPKGKRTLI